MQTRMARLASCLVCALLIAAPLLAQRPQRLAPTISGYIIDAEIDPEAHHLAARVVVSFTAPEGSGPVSFGLHPALKVSKITDETGNVLPSQRAADGSLCITPAAPIVQGQTLRWSFEYEGIITGNNDGPIAGLKLAAIQEPVTYLLYAARWLPVSGSSSGYPIDRFTAEMHISAPQGMQVFASGSQGEARPVTLANGKPGEQYGFNWTKPGFPGTVIAGRYAEPVAVGAGNVKVWLTPGRQKAANEVAQTAAKEFEFFAGSFGSPESNRLNVVEVPEGALPAVWAPELAAIPGSMIGDSSGARLLASTIARQWWGSVVSPHTLDDAWITNGMARYAELMYVEEQGGGNALKETIPDVSAGALAYDSIPLSSAGRLGPFSSEFQSMTMEKGAMIFHMLRWEIGDKTFLGTLRETLRQFAGKSTGAAEFKKLAEAASRQPLTAFFAQWVDGTGAPQFTSKYAIYRLGNNKGFRTMGEIEQNQELFHMPVELRVETDGKTETRKIEVAGMETPFDVETFGRPRRVIIDPQNWLLKSTPALQVRVSILRGQQRAAQGDLAGALAEYQKALEINAQSSLANYRIGEALFSQRNYPASVNAFRDALGGDGEPRWTEVWSHIALGKIFDLTGQRDRAMNEYRLAAQTGDNGQGAVNEAQMYLQKPYQRPDSE